MTKRDELYKDLGQAYERLEAAKLEVTNASRDYMFARDAVEHFLAENRNV